MQNLLIKIYKNRKISAFLQIFSHVVSAIGALAFLFVLGYSAYLEEYVNALVLGASAFVGFVLVSLVRRLFDAPRPYEIYDFYERRPKEREGSSFPSRHAYSAFAIAIIAFSVSYVMGAALLLISAMMCVSRVLLGIHFIRDVLAGAVIGAIAGGIGLLLVF